MLREGLNLLPKGNTYVFSIYGTADKPNGNHFTSFIDLDTSDINITANNLNGRIVLLVNLHVKFLANEIQDNIIELEDGGLCYRIFKIDGLPNYLFENRKTIGFLAVLRNTAINSSSTVTLRLHSDGGLSISVGAKYQYNEILEISTHTLSREGDYYWWLDRQKKPRVNKQYFTSFLYKIGGGVNVA